MPGMFDAHELGIPCSTCGKENKKKISWIKTHHEFTCRCGQVINLKSESLIRELGKVDAAVEKLKNKGVRNRFIHFRYKRFLTPFCVFDF